MSAALAMPEPGALRLVHPDPLGPVLDALATPTPAVMRDARRWLDHLSAMAHEAAVVALSPVTAPATRAREVATGRRELGLLLALWAAVDALPDASLAGLTDSVPPRRYLARLVAAANAAAHALDLAAVLTPLRATADCEAMKTKTSSASNVGQPSAGSNIVRVKFEGKPFISYNFRGRPCWIATEVGQTLGYGNSGKSLANAMRTEWADELIAGEDFDVLTGQDLADFKAFLRDAWESNASSTARLTILYESGLNLVCIKTEKPLGKKLRRFLANEVLPKLRRGEPILPDQNSDLIRSLSDRMTGMETLLAEKIEQVDTLKCEVIDLHRRMANNQPTDGLVGAHDAGIYILRPLKALASQVADMRGQSFRKVLTDLDRQVREAADHPKAKKGNKWERLPQVNFGHARRAIFNLQDQHKAELDAHAQRVAASRQMVLKPTG